MSLKMRMAIALAIPLLTTLVFLGMIVLDSQRNLAQMRALGSVVALAERASAVIHEMQIERGLSVGYISSGREAAQLTTLKAQREKVDAAAARFSGFVGDSGITRSYPRSPPVWRRSRRRWPRSRNSGGGSPTTSSPVRPRASTPAASRTWSH